MSDTAQAGITIGNPNDPVRIALRLSRLRQALERAEGDRRTALEAEIAAHEAKLAEIKAALEAAGV